jgi:hypothetical protein
MKCIIRHNEDTMYVLLVSLINVCETTKPWKCACCITIILIKNVSLHIELRIYTSVHHSLNIQTSAPRHLKIHTSLQNHIKIYTLRQGLVIIVTRGPDGTISKRQRVSSNSSLFNDAFSATQTIASISNQSWFVCHLAATACWKASRKRFSTSETHSFVRLFIHSFIY